MHQEIGIWIEAILRDPDAAWKALQESETVNHVHLIEVCHSLLDDSSVSVRAFALRALAFLGDADDPFAEKRAIQALREPVLRDLAFIALAEVSTSAAFETLLEFAEAGSPLALRAARRQVRSEQQAQQVLELARSLIFSEVPKTRTMAVRVLSALSTPADEETLLIRAVILHPDDVAISALGRATPAALPFLEEMLSLIGPDYAESRELEHAIGKLRTRESEDAWIPTPD